MVMEGKGNKAHKELRNEDAIDEIERNDLSSGHTSGSEYVPSIESFDTDAVHLAPDSTCEVQTPKTANKSINEDSRGYYRLSENTIQLAKISKLLLAIEQGASSYKGKSLDEIDLNLDDTEPLFSMDSRSAPESQECSSDEENDLCGPADNGNDADADSEAELGLSVPKKQRRNHATSPVPDNDSDSGQIALFKLGLWN
ncbi:hypothetical protein QTP86_014220 [Hemibagrus guttatus]|nr:hypothetical protein QTP86_014220 [Hemibagrus guttatus]